MNLAFSVARGDRCLALLPMLDKQTGPAIVKILSERSIKKQTVGGSMARRILRSNRKTGSLVRDAQMLRQKREEVAEAAFDLFLKQGFHGTTTRDVTRRAGISAGALFTYFPSKEDILVHIITREQERAESEFLDVLRQQIDAAVRNNADPETVFVTVFAAFVRSVDRMRRFILLAYQETKSLNQPARQALIAREKRLQAVLGEAIEYGVQRGRFAPGNIGLKAHNLMVLAHAWAIRHWVFVGAMNSVEEYIAFLQPLVLAMLEKKAELSTAAGGQRAISQFAPAK